MNTMQLLEMMSGYCEDDHRERLVEELEQKGAFYDVQLVDNYWIKGSTLGYPNLVSTGKRTVVNVDLGVSIGVVSDRYVPVLNKEIFEKFNEVLVKCEDIDLEGAYTEVQTNADGARIMVEYVLPAHTVTLANGDEVALRITALNSFDGSTGFKVYCGGIRFKCMNGMVLGDMMATYQKSHCAGLSLDGAAKTIETGLRAYLNGVDAWNEQIKTPISPEDVFACLAELADLNTLGATTYAEFKELQGNNARLGIIDHYWDKWREYEYELGTTQWALNNTLTHISTHGVRKNKPQIKSQVNKAEKVVKLIRKYLTTSSQEG